MNVERLSAILEEMIIPYFMAYNIKVTWEKQVIGSVLEDVSGYMQQNTIRT